MPIQNYLWCAISMRTMRVRWEVTTDPHPTHDAKEKWILVTTFFWPEG